MALHDLYCCYFNLLTKYTPTVGLVAVAKTNNSYDVDMSTACLCNLSIRQWAK